MAVRIRLKKMGRAHKPFYRMCVMDAKTARDGRVIEEVGYYDPMVADTDARAILKGDRIAYWLGVGAQPTEKVAVLIKKYGANGTHLDKQKAALERTASRNRATALALSAARQTPAKGKGRAAAAEAPEPAEATGSDEG